MKFKIKDLLWNSYYGENMMFKTKKEIHEELKRYHEGVAENKTRKQEIKKMSLSAILDTFSWKIVKIN